jgi:1-acyl-sn-glycerol-3-phosphate acyltransferase
MSVSDPALPRRSEWMIRWFQRYCLRYAAKNFHGVRLSKTSFAVPDEPDVPQLFVMNHPAWWDVITSFVLSARAPHRKHYAPIEAAMLAKYRMFAKLGLFGVEPTPRGAAIFLRTAKAIFERPQSSLWVTAQGRFSDVRERPIRLRPGVGGVAARMTRGVIVPVAFEYPFWTEKTPETLIRFGEPMDVRDGNGLDSQAWTRLIEDRLTDTMDVLAAEAIRRDPDLFTEIVGGRAGVGGVYDRWRRFRAFLRGQRFDPAHVARTESPGQSVEEAVAR